MISIASSICGRVPVALMPNASSCQRWLARPQPSCTRPFDARSRVAVRSATRSGWLKANGSSVTMWRMLMRWVCAAIAPYGTSGAVTVASGLTKWCSDVPQWSKPISSARGTSRTSSR